MKRIILIGVSLLALSCSNQKEEKGPQTEALSPLSSEEVLRTYNLYRDGRYAELVDAILSCDGKDAAYREQMATLFKQHAADQKEQNGDIRSTAVNAIVTDTTGNAATASLLVTYANGDTETIQLQFIRSEGKWRLR